MLPPEGLANGWLLMLRHHSTVLMYHHTKTSQTLQPESQHSIKNLKTPWYFLYNNMVPRMSRTEFPSPRKIDSTYFHVVLRYTGIQSSCINHTPGTWWSLAFVRKDLTRFIPQKGKLEWLNKLVELFIDFIVTGFIIFQGRMV